MPSNTPLPLITRYFAELPADRIALLSRLCDEVRDWNAKINLISRKDIDHLEAHHVLHSLAVAKVWQPAAGASAVDLGSGGGFPGLPLAIVFPECRFTLVDFVGKKMLAVGEIVAALGLPNVTVVKERAENLTERFDVVLGRAVAVLPQFLDCALPLVKPRRESKPEAQARGEPRFPSLARRASKDSIPPLQNGDPIQGVFYFKGSRYQEELADDPRQPTHVWPLHDLFGEEYFAEKFLLYFESGKSAGGR